MKDIAHRKGVGCDGKVTVTETPAMAVTWPGKDSRVSPGENAGVQHLTQAMMIGIENCKACCHLPSRTEPKAELIELTRPESPICVAIFWPDVTLDIVPQEVHKTVQF